MWNLLMVLLCIWTLLAVVLVILQGKQAKQRAETHKEQQQAKEEVKRMWDEILSNLPQKR